MVKVTSNKQQTTVNQTNNPAYHSVFKTHTQINCSLTKHKIYVILL